MSIKGQGHSLTLVKDHSDFKVKCLTFGLYTQVSDSGPNGPLVNGGFPLLRNFNVAISVSPRVCFILVLSLTSMLLR